MATLTEIAYYSRKIFKYGLIAILVIILLKLVYDVGKGIFLKLYPPLPPAPTVKYGKLPKIEFPQKNQLSATEYLLETPNGKLPDSPTQVKIYPFLELRPSLLAPENAKKEANTLGFSGNPEVITEQLYRWSKTIPQLLTLEMDIFTGTFKLTYDWQNDPEILTNINLPAKNQAIDEAKEYLKRKSSNNDLLEGRYEAAYLKANGSLMIPAVSLSEANFIKVEVYRQNVDELPMVTENPQQGIAMIIFSGNRSAEKHIVEARYNYFPVNLEFFSTYPIKTAVQAWEELKNNQGFIAGWQGTGKVIVRRIYLAYFDSTIYQKYLQPVFVFQGDDNFTVYLPAVSADYLE